jgi:type I restriction enzyme S subunit
MKYGLSELTIEKIRGVFAQFSEIEKAVLYGSRAKGNFKTGSDIDLTLYGAAITSDLHATIADRLDDLLLPYSIDLSLFDELDHAKLREHIERVGMVFYERENQGVDMKAGWQRSVIGDYCEVIAGQSPEGKYYNAEGKGMPFYQGKKDFGDRFIKAPTTWTTETTKTAKKDDVLMSVRAPVGPVNFATKDICIGRGLAAIRSKGKLDVDFLFYQLLYLQPEIAGKEGAVFASINKSEIAALPISIGPLPEQQRIVSILDEAFDGIATAKANAEKNLQNARAIFESYLQSVFSQKGEGWELKTLEQIAIIFGRGKSRHRPRNEPMLYGGKYPFIQTGDIRNSDHFIMEYSQTYNEAGLAQSKIWPKGTICITIAANIAETGILGFDACFPDSVIGIVTNPKEADVDFVEYLLQSFKARLQAMGKGSAQANINMGTFENERFPFPSVTEQKEIVVKLNSLREETKRIKSIYRRKSAALDELKKSLLHQAFSGDL